MTAIFFDTLAYANKLKHAGFTTKQAECQAELTAELFEHNIATKEDINQLVNRLERDMRELKKDIIISIGSMIMAAVAVIPIILKLIHL